MKVGDLVRKKSPKIAWQSARVAGLGGVARVGLLVDLGEGIATVNWFSHGTFMTPAHTLEIVNESR